jgi:hypothetical protein
MAEEPERKTSGIFGVTLFAAFGAWGAAILGPRVAGYFGAMGRFPWQQSVLHRLRPSRKSDEEEHMKKISLLSLLIMATLLFTLAFPVAAAGPKAPAAPVPAAPVVAPVAGAAAAVPEPHPHIHEGLEAMRAAKHHLESADHDFDGHRVKAIEHLNAAIHEAEICESMR